MDFSRISNAVDINLLQNTRIVGVGAGGAYCLYEALTRTGVGHLTVLDFDTVDEVNFCRQGFAASQIGMKKVDALAEHLHSINPNLDYKGITKNFLDMTDAELDEIFGSADLLLFLTDSFKAQAFGNKLALRYKKSAIWGGFYEQSQCAEIVFYIPGVTPACFRCVVAPRYEAQAVKEIKVSSNCNTMFHSQMLDSMIGMIAMAILHNNTTGFTFSEWFGEYWDQNLIQFKTSPDYESRLFDRLIQNSGGYALCFDAIWQRISKHGCPDCEELE
jgi:molybdopterin/thiamine biosynthesis adenylyltransferase